MTTIPFRDFFGAGAGWASADMGSERRNAATNRSARGMPSVDQKEIGRKQRNLNRQPGRVSDIWPTGRQHYATTSNRGSGS